LDHNPILEGATMTSPLRLLVAAAALNGTLGAGVAGAQTLFLRNAPAAATVEVIVNGVQTGAGTVGADGNASVPFTLAKDAAPPEMDANVFVDACGPVRRVVLMERGRPPAPADAACDRREIAGVFWVRPVNTLVIDLGGANPTLLLVRGRYTPPVPTAEGEEASAGPRRRAPAGFVLFGGGGLTQFRDATNIACGNVSNCADSSGIGYSFGAGYWITRYIGAEVTYLNPKTLTIDGGGDTFTFTNTLNANMTTIAGLLALPLGPVRLYGKGGVNYHQATSDTSQTIGDATQTFQVDTSGWSWVAGGGGEAWLTQKFALYGEVGRARVKGEAEVGGSGSLDDRLGYVLFGARIRLGG
jgi:hypothetical protein